MCRKYPRAIHHYFYNRDERFPIVMFEKER
jgi:hypothetical protein